MAQTVKVKIVEYGEDLKVELIDYGEGRVARRNFPSGPPQIPA